MLDTTTNHTAYEALIKLPSDKPPILASCAVIERERENYSLARAENLTQNLNSVIVSAHETMPAVLKCDRSAMGFEKKMYYEEIMMLIQLRLLFLTNPESRCALSLDRC